MLVEKIVASEIVDKKDLELGDVQDEFGESIFSNPPTSSPPPPREPYDEGGDPWGDGWMSFDLGAGMFFLASVMLLNAICMIKLMRKL